MTAIGPDCVKTSAEIQGSRCYADSAEFVAAISLGVHEQAPDLIID